MTPYWPANVSGTRTVFPPGTVSVSSGKVSPGFTRAMAKVPFQLYVLSRIPPSTSRMVPVNQLVAGDDLVRQGAGLLSDHAKPGSTTGRRTSSRQVTLSRRADTREPAGLAGCAVTRARHAFSFWHQLLRRAVGDTIPQPGP